MYVTLNNFKTQNISFSAKPNKSSGKTNLGTLSCDEFISSKNSELGTIETYKRKLIEKINPKEAMINNVLDLVDYRNSLGISPELDISRDDFCNTDNFEHYINNLKKIIYIPNRKEQFTESVISALMYNPKVLDNVVKHNLHLPIKGRNQDLSFYDIQFLAEENDNSYDLMMKNNLFSDIKGRENPLSGYELKLLSKAICENKEKISQKTFSNIKERNLLTLKFKSGEYLTMPNVIALALLSKSDWKNLKDNDILKYHKSYSPDLIPELVNIADEDFDKISEIVKMYDGQINSKDFSIITKFSKKSINDAQKLFGEGSNIVNLSKFLYFAVYDSDIKEKFEQAYNLATEKQKLVFKDYDGVPKGTLEEFFELYQLRIYEFIDLFGMEAFNYLLSEGYDNMTDLLDVIDTPSSSEYAFYTIEQREELKKRLADKSILPEEKIQKGRAVLSMPTIELKGRLINLINSNKPTKEQMNLAKKIWASKDKSFEEKLLAFNNEFGTADNKKVQAFFNKKAYIVNGEKNLFSINSKEMSQLIQNEVNKKQNEKLWNATANNIFFNDYLDLYALNFSNKDILLDKLNLVQSPYLSKLLYMDRKAFRNFCSMLKIIDSLPDKSIKDTLNLLPQNKITKEEFEKYGIDYERWITPDENLVVPVNVKIDKKRAEMKIIQNLEEDFIHLEKSSIPQEEKDKIFNKLSQKGIILNQENVFELWDNDLLAKNEEKRLYKNGKRIGIDDAKEIINEIISMFDNNTFWMQNLDKNSTLRTDRDNFYYHLTNMRTKEIADLKKINNDMNKLLTVRQVDMNNVAHSLFLGNHAGCCTAIGSSEQGNSYAAPRYIMDKFISAIEVLDGDKPIGNTMCYFIKHNNKPALVLDNIELLGKYQNINSITQAIIETASRLCDAVGVRECNIYAGPYRHKVDLEKFPMVGLKFNVLGDTDVEATYLDFTGETLVAPDVLFTSVFYKLR